MTFIFFTAVVEQGERMSFMRQYVSDVLQYIFKIADDIKTDYQWLWQEINNSVMVSWLVVLFLYIIIIFS